MSARNPMGMRLAVAAALAVAAIACEDGGPDAAAAAGPGGNGVPEAAASVAPPVVSPHDPPQLAVYDEQQRADLAADVQARVDDAHKWYGPDVPLRVESGLFVLVGIDHSPRFQADADLAQRALDVYLARFFARRPDRAVTVSIVHREAELYEIGRAHV